MDRTNEYLYEFYGIDETSIRETKDFLNKFSHIAEECGTGFENNISCRNLFFGTNLLLNRKKFLDTFKVPLYDREKYIANYHAHVKVAMADILRERNYKQGEIYSETNDEIVSDYSFKLRRQYTFKFLEQFSEIDKRCKNLYLSDFNFRGGSREGNCTNIYMLTHSLLNNIIDSPEVSDVLQSSIKNILFYAMNTKQIDMYVEDFFVAVEKE